jgi:lysophospholipase L1-like esterase
VGERSWMLAGRMSGGNGMKQRVLPLIAAVLLIAGGARAQLADEFSPPPSNCCLAITAKGLADQLLDWNQLGRYNRANQELKKQPAEPKRVVFMGDSITDGWRFDEYFPNKPYVGRGISGQTTPQMLVRMYPDVIELKPAAMVLLAGTNDVARNTGPATAEMIEQNIMAMTELSQLHGIKVILCSVLPVSDYPFLKQSTRDAPPQGPAGPFRGPMRRIRMTEGHPPADILKLNAWMRDYAGRANAIYVDYFAALVDEKGWLKESYSGDGLHPNAEGYKVMAPLVEAAIQKALQ